VENISRDGSGDPGGHLIPPIHDPVFPGFFELQPVSFFVCQMTICVSFYSKFFSKCPVIFFR